MSRVFTVIGFWGEASERQVVGVIEGIHEVTGGYGLDNYGSGGPFAMVVSAIDAPSAESMVAGTTEDDDIDEVEFTEEETPEELPISVRPTRLDGKGF